MTNKKPTRTFTHKNLKTKAKKVTRASSRPKRKKTTPLKKKVISPKTKGQINKRLSKIYQDADGTMPDMHHFTHGSRHRFRRLLLITTGILLIFSAAAWAGFLFFGSHGPSFLEEDVRVVISAPEQVAVGEDITYRIRIANTQTLQLAQTELSLTYPEGFVINETSLLPLDNKQNKWRFGTLDGGKDVVLDITGTLVGDINSEQSLRAFFTYRPSNFNSPFQAVETFTHTLASTPALLDLSAPETATAGDEITVSLTVSNATTEAAGPFDVRLVANKQFVLADVGELPEGVSSPEPGVWHIESLAGSDAIILTQAGAFTTDAASQETLRAQISQRQDGIDYIQAQADHTVSLQATSLNLSFIANGSSNNLTVAPEEPITFSLFYKNTGEKTINNLSIKAILDVPSVGGVSVLPSESLDAGADPIIDETQVNPDTQQITLSWSRQELSSLAQLSGGAEDSIPFTMSLASQTAFDYSALNQFTISALAQGEFDDGAQVTIQTPPLLIFISSDTALQASITPVNPETLEPTSAETDTYIVYWELDNTVHQLSNATVKSTILGTIDLLGQETSVGSLTHDEPSGNVEWLIGDVQTDGTQSASLIIQIKKTLSGQTVLMTPSTLQAEDTIISKSILRSAPSIALP